MYKSYNFYEDKSSAVFSVLSHSHITQGHQADTAKSLYIDYSFKYKLGLLANLNKVSFIPLILNKSLARFNKNPFHQGFLTGIATINLCEFCFVK